MTYTLESLRDRENARFIAVQTGSISAVAMVLYAKQSGTSNFIPVQCNSVGMLLTSGL